MDRDDDYFVAFGNLNSQDMEVCAQLCLSAILMLFAFVVSDATYTLVTWIGWESMLINPTTEWIGHGKLKVQNISLYLITYDAHVV